MADVDGSGASLIRAARGRRRVLRRRFDYVFGLLLVAGLLTYSLYGLVWPYPGSSFPDQLELVFLGLVPSWLCWLIAVHPRIELGESELIVVNWFVRHDVPWALVDSVDVADGVVIALRDGRALRPASGSRSLASALRGNDVQQAMANARTRSALGPDPVRPRSRLDLDARLFIPLGLVLLLIGWFAVR